VTDAENEPFKMTAKRGLLMLIALLPQTLFIMAFIGFVVMFFIEKNSIRMLVGITMFFVLLPLGGWYGGKKWNILAKRFQEEDKQ